MVRHPVPDEHLKCIGDITVSFALLESSVQSLVWSMLNERQRIGQIVTAELSFRNLRSLLISLYIERHGKQDKDFGKLKELVERTASAEDKRNQITHSIWASCKELNSITRIKTTAKEKNGFKFQFEDVKLNQLNEIASDIKILTSEIRCFWIYLMENGKAINDHTINKLP
ncbi:MAG: hypothetical protein WAR79_05805 [Melioribacteraceae bacterium]